MPSIPTSDFIDLDDWSVMNVLDYVAFNDLLTLCNVESGLCQLITKHYIPKYQIDEKIIRLRSTSLPSIVSDESVHIGGLHQAKVFLRNFGHLITHLKLNEDIERDAEIREYIVEYCSKTLNELTLCSPDSYFLRDTPTTFTALTKFNLAYPKRTDIYPELYRIYPNLKELSFTPSLLYHTQETERYIFEMLQRAPELRTFSIDKLPSFDALRTINDIQPNLNVLKIVYCLDIFEYLKHNETIHFNNVNSLFVNVEDKFDTRSNRFPLEFDRLERLEIRMSHIDNVPIEMIKRSVRLKSLSLPTHCEMSDLLSILDRVNQTNAIEEVTVPWTSSNGLAFNTNRLMNDYPTLKIITFGVSDGLASTTNRDALIGMITTAWTIDGNWRNGDDQRDYITIKRIGRHLD